MNDLWRLATQRAPNANSRDHGSGSSRPTGIPVLHSAPYSEGAVLAIRSIIKAFEDHNRNTSSYSQPTRHYTWYFLALDDILFKQCCFLAKIGGAPSRINNLRDSSRVHRILPKEL